MEADKVFKKAEVERSREELDRALVDYQQVAELAGRSSWLAAEATHMQGVIFIQKESYEQAEQTLKEAKDLFQKLDDLSMVGAVLRDLGLVAKNVKDYPKAQQLLVESINLLQETPQKGYLGISQVKLGGLKAAMGDLVEAENLIQQGISNITGSPNKFFEVLAYLELASVYKQAGKQEASKLTAQKSLELLNQISDVTQYQGKRLEINKLLTSN